MFIHYKIPQKHFSTKGKKIKASQDAFISAVNKD